MSQPIVKVRGMKQDLTKTEKNEKPKRSNFLLTISTNQQIEKENIDNDIEIFDKCIQDILNNVQDYINLPDPSDWNDEKIKNVDIDYTIEEGSKFHRLHIHILFKFTHFTKILLNYDKIKKKITDDLGLQNVYMLNKLVRNSGGDNILDYLKKLT